MATTTLHLYLTHQNFQSLASKTSSRMSLDHRTKLEIGRLYKKQHLRISEIRAILDGRGIKTSWQTINRVVQRNINGDFDLGCSNPVDGMEIRRFDSITSDSIIEIQKTFEENPAQSNRDIRRKLAENGTNISRTTAQRAIHAAGYTNSQPRYCSMIREKNKVSRVEFCKELIERDDNLADVVFTDECTVQLHGNSVTCYRPRHSVAVHIPVPKHSLKCHVWGGISKRGATQLLIFDGIMRKEFFVGEILDKTLRPFISLFYPDGARFQQDNDPKHTSRLAKDYLATNNINTINWPSESCDLNPIEMVWSEMKYFISRQHPRTKTDLVTAIQSFWHGLTAERCVRYIDHVFKVAPVCILMNGNSTGDLPGRIFTERSFGKSFGYFDRKLKDPDVYNKAIRLLSVTVRD